MYNKFFKCTIVILLLLVIPGCNDVKNDNNIGLNNNLYKYYDENNNNFFQQYSTEEENFCFYIVDMNEQTGYSEIQLCFPTSVEKVIFDDLKFYYQGEQVDNAGYSIISKNDFSITLRLSSYISRFDCITGYYNEKESFFYTGSYYFEKIDLDTTGKYTVRSMKNSDNNLELISEVDIFPKPQKGNYIVPKQLLEKNYIKPYVIDYNENTNLSKTIISLNADNVLQNGVKRLSFESIWLVDTDQSKNLMLKRVNTFEV